MQLKKQKVKKKKYRKLQNTVLCSFAMLAAVLIVIIGFVIADQYIRKEMEDTRKSAFAYTRSLAELIDGDKIAQYLETGEKDEYYNEIQDVIDSYQKNADLQYYYVFVPFEDDLMYIWDADTELGYCEEYMEGGKEATFSIYKQNPPEEIELADDDTYGYIASAYSPVFDSNGEPVAVVGADLYMTDLQNNMRDFLVVAFFAIILVVLFAVISFFVFIKRKIVNPINTIRNASQKMVENLESDENIEIKVETRNEIEELCDSLTQMYGDIKDYIDKLSTVTAEKERIGAELDVAAHIQSSMLPCIFPAFPERKEFDIYATMDPAKEVGGDFYDFFMVDDRHLAIVMADVSGKGVPAALFMVIGKTLIKDHTLPDRDLGEVFTAVNNLLCEANSEGLFITAFEGVLDLETGEFNFVNAGHEMPFICKAGGEFEPYKIRPGFVLAGMEGMKYSAGSMQLEVGDKIFQYTDGVTEATNANNELYGMARLGEILNKAKSGTPHDILPAVKKDIEEFVCEAPQFDDITMLCLEYKSKTGDAKVKELNIEATVENIETVTNFVNEQLEALDCPIKAQMQIDIAIDELFGNIAHYAYNPETGCATVRVEVLEDPLSVVITFIDKGVPYDPLAKADPNTTLSAEEREIGGLGIYMVKKSMDEIIYEYKDGQNILKIKKNLE